MRTQTNFVWLSDFAVVPGGSPQGASTSDQQWAVRDVLVRCLRAKGS